MPLSIILSLSRSISAPFHCFAVCLQSLKLCSDGFYFIFSNSKTLWVCVMKGAVSGISFNLLPIIEVWRQWNTHAPNHSSHSKWCNWWEIQRTDWRKPRGGELQQGKETDRLHIVLVKSHLPQCLHQSWSTGVKKANRRLKPCITDLSEFYNFSVKSHEKLQADISAPGILWVCSVIWAKL